MVDRTIDTSKEIASGRQIQAAIRHYNDGHFECAITLAHAAENMVAKGGVLSLFNKLKEKMAGTDHNAVANWLKHSSGPDTATISELEVITMIQRAISSFHGRFGAITHSMKAFAEAAKQKLERKA